MADPSSQPGAEPLVVDVKRNSLDDGPGIRSVVFFKGCPLRCVWCQNPEALSPVPELQRDPERCVGCGACTLACSRGTARPGREAQRGAGCTLCGSCAAACPSSARRVAGTRWSVEGLTDLLLRDKPFYASSGGGVTLSGGEPTLHAEFAGRLAASLAARAVHVLLETCGHFDWDRFAREVLPHLATIYCDLKLADAEAHRRYTGRDNGRILDNLGRLAVASPGMLVPRVPLVPGVTDDAGNLSAIAGILVRLRIGRVALLRYNPLWIPKRRALGLDLPYAHAQWMTRDRVEECAEPFRRAGLAVTL